MSSIHQFEKRNGKKLSCAGNFFYLFYLRKAAVILLSLCMLFAMMPMMPGGWVHGADDGYISINTGEELSTMSGGKKYILMEDIDLTSGGQLDIDSDIVINLNGHSISSKSSRIFYVKQGGNLTIEDSSEAKSGTITGCAGEGENGGAVYNAGWFTFCGGKISGSTAENGGGVYNAGIFSFRGGKISGSTAENGGGVYNAGYFFFEGGEITGNKAETGGGIHAAESEKLRMSGNVVVKNNRKITKDEKSNVYLGDFTLDLGNIKELSEIWVTYRDGDFANCSAIELAPYFYCDDSNYVVKYRKDGEKALGFMLDPELCQNHQYTEIALAEYFVKSANCQHGTIYQKSCKFCGTPHDTETFETGEKTGHDYIDGWCSYCGEEAHLYIDSNGWKVYYEDLQEAFECALNNSTITVISDYTDTSEPILQRNGKTLTLNLNEKKISVQTGNARLQRMADIGQIVISTGNLTITGNGTCEAVITQVGGNLTIENGDFLELVVTDSDSERVTVLNGGTFGVSNNLDIGIMYVFEGKDKETAKAAIKNFLGKDKKYSKEEIKFPNANMAYINGPVEVVDDKPSGSAGSGGHYNPLSNDRYTAVKNIDTFIDLSNYDLEEQKVIKELLEKAKANIYKADSKTAIADIEEAVKEEIDKIKTSEEKIKEAEIVERIETVKKTKLAARSNRTTLNGKKAITISWLPKENAEIKTDFDGYEIYRSEKRNSGYGNKPFFVSRTTKYTNNKALKKGVTYYYKVRGFVEIDGERRYSGWSLKAWNSIK